MSSPSRRYKTQEPKYLHSSDGKHKFYSHKKHRQYEEELASKETLRKLESLMGEEEKEEKKMEKQNQIKMKMNVECVGHPMEKNLDRIKCTRQVEIQLPGVDFAKNTQEKIRLLGEKQWHRLKTFGVFQYYCPQCTTVILDKREDSKFRWG